MAHHLEENHLEEKMIVKRSSYVTAIAPPLRQKTTEKKSDSLCDVILHMPGTKTKMIYCCDDGDQLMMTDMI